MIRNFERVKKQLEELAPLINSFKAEAVQLRIVDLVLRGGGFEEPADEPERTEPRPPKAKRAKPASVVPRGSGKLAAGKRKAGGTGAMPTLSQLLDEEFFKKPQTLNQILEHCSSAKARIFKASQFSGPLGRLVRDGKLKRKKNADAQYEYWKP